MYTNISLIQKIFLYFFILINTIKSFILFVEKNSQTAEKGLKWSASRAETTFITRCETFRYYSAKSIKCFLELVIKTREMSNKVRIRVYLPSTPEAIIFYTVVPFPLFALEIYPPLTFLLTMEGILVCIAKKNSIIYLRWICFKHKMKQ